MTGRDRFVFSFLRRTRPEPDEGSRYYALLYAVSLRQRRTETGARAFSWAAIRNLSDYPGSVGQLIIDVTLQIDDLERLAVERSEMQKREITGSNVITR